LVPTFVRIAVLTRADEPFSFRNYRENLLAHFGRDIAISTFGLADPVPADCDLVWDPGLGMAKVPRELMRAMKNGLATPVVGTVHGLRVFSLPMSEFAFGVIKTLQLAIAKIRRRHEWRSFGPGLARVIGVSEFGAMETMRAFSLPPVKVTKIYYGLDHDVYNMEGERESRDRPFLLHVSSYQRKKNVERIVAVYESLPVETRPDLVLVLPGAPRGFEGRPGVTLIDRGLTARELAPWYRGALAFLFPSLHETFGMPIVEAMACGCPVLTASTTACPEAAGPAGLFVDPRDDAALREGMERLSVDANLRARLSAAGLEHAAGFSWQTCADRHLDVFRQVVEQRS
jgi:glycosyltransferase involved in cell wall biosynthesis